MFIDWISLRRSTAVRRGGTHSLKPPASMSERGQSQRKNVLRALFLVLYFVPAIEQFSSNVHLTITKTKNKERYSSCRLSLIFSAVFGPIPSTRSSPPPATNFLKSSTEENLNF